MSYIRVKRLKKSGGEYEYAYLVGSHYRRRRKSGWNSRVEQKYLKYLGRVYSFEERFICGLDDYFSIVSLENLLLIELMKRGFAVKGGVHVLDDINGGTAFHQHATNSKGIGVVSVDLKRRIVSCCGRDCVVRIGEGFLCSHTLDEVFGFGRVSSREEGVLFLKSLLKCGVRPDAELFGRLVEGMME